MMRRFLLTNAMVLTVGAAAWQAGLLEWAKALPQTTWLMIGFLFLMWIGGMAFAIAGQWRTVFHIANAIPMAGLVLTGIGIQVAGAGITGMTPDAAFALFRGILQSMSTTFIGLALMMSLREISWWVGSEHV
jgi:hypothetical protein